MKKVSALMLLSLLLIFASSFTAADKDSLFASKEGKMSISFPSSFNKEADNSNGVNTVKISSSLGEQTYFASYTLHNIELNDPESLAEVSLNSFNEVVGGEINKKEVWKLKAGKGLNAIIDLADQEAIIVYRVIIVNNIQYQIVVISPNSSFDKKVADKFLNSFKLLK